MFRNFLLSVLLLFPVYVQAQDVPDEIAPSNSRTPANQKQEILELKEIVKGKSGLSKRIIFIIDVSGSMVGEGKIGKALKFIQAVWQSPVDEFEIAVIVFNDKSTRWEGFPSPKDDPKPAPKGWAKLPSKDATDAAQKFLDKYPGAGNTNPDSAFEIALKEDRSDLCIIFITDGDYDHGPQPTLDLIKKLQEEREKKGLGKAVISVFGVGDAEKQTNLSEIGKTYLGGFYIEKPDPKTEDNKNSDPNGPPKSKTSLTDDSSEEDIFQGFHH